MLNFTPRLGLKRSRPQPGHSQISGHGQRARACHGPSRFHSSPGDRADRLRPGRRWRGPDAQRRVLRVRIDRSLAWWFASRTNDCACRHGPRWSRGPPAVHRARLPLEAAKLFPTSERPAALVGSRRTRRAASERRRRVWEKSSKVPARQREGDQADQKLCMLHIVRHCNNERWAMEGAIHSAQG